MPKPVINPCGQPGQPACPPVPTVVTEGDIALAFMSLTPEQQQAGVEANTDHPHHHFWKAFIDALKESGNDVERVLGEVKFGGE